MQLEAATSNLKFFVGTATGTKTYTREELLKHVRALDEIGLEFIKTQMDFLRSFRTGEMTDLLSGAEAE
jgi:hypothetical protein